MELKDTVKLMLSDDYKDRFIAEYKQTTIRWDKLGRFLYQFDIFEDEQATFNNVPISLLRKQYDVMDEYLTVLEERAMLEKIDIHSDRL